MHVRRGDSIYFVNGRSQTKTETARRKRWRITSIFRGEYESGISAGDKPEQNTKVQWLQEKNMRIFYGDSDNDITAARDCGIRGIRILARG